MQLSRVRQLRLVSSVAVFTATLLVASGCALIASGPAEAKRSDNTPPTFAGLKSATTCIPGPIGGGRTTSYHLSWDPASDDVTPQKKIVYDVYQATTSGGEDFSTPTYTTGPGATSFATPPLTRWAPARRCARASRVWHAVTPEPQWTMVRSGGTPSRAAVSMARSSSADLKVPSGRRLSA